MARFSGYLLLFDLSCLILAGIPVYLLVGSNVFVALVIAFLITTLLAILSYFPFTRMSGASMNRYMAAMLTGMLIRMVFIGLSIAVVFVFTELHQFGFTVGLLFSYICKAIIETFIISQKHRGNMSAQ